MWTKDLLTPCVVIEKSIVEKNLHTAQKIFDAMNINFRPHIKTHKIPVIAKWQIELGAKGINCQKISEAIPFVNAGIQDILITYNIMGTEKLNNLYDLSQKCDLKVTADSAVCIKGLSETFSKNNGTVKVLVECDTGAGRCGVQSPEEALKLAELIDTSEGLEFYGLMTYPAPYSEVKTEEFLSTTKKLIEEKNIDVKMITSGGTPSIFDAPKYSVITEYRAGTYIYCDRSLVTLGMCELSDCALTVQATVVSMPSDNRCIIDAGSKALTSDLLNQSDYGYIKQFSEAKIIGLSEEHGTVDLSNCTTKPRIGDIINIIPNHCCPVTNLYNTVTYVTGNTVLETYSVDARGCVV